MQKNALRIILKERYTTYDEALNALNLQNLENRRVMLCKKFAVSCVNNVRTRKHFQLSEKTHPMKTRRQVEFNVEFANTERFRKSTIPFLQRLLNEEM